MNCLENLEQRGDRLEIYNLHILERNRNSQSSLPPPNKHTPDIWGWETGTFTLRMQSPPLLVFLFKKMNILCNFKNYGLDLV